MHEIQRKSGLVVHSPVLKVFNYVLLVLAATAIIAPILSLFVIAFKTNEEYAATQIVQLPKNPTLENFRIAIVDGKMHIGLKNIIILTVPSVTIAIMIGSMAAYALGRFDFKINGLIMRLFLLAMVIPLTTTLISVFQVIKALGAFNTLWAGLLLYTHTGVIDLYIYLQFIRKIPKDQDECAMLDGASYFRIFYTIILPQMKPAIATVLILRILGIYNDYFVPLTFMTKPHLYTLSISLYRFINDHFQRWNVLAAGILLLLIPTIIIYIFTQKYIIAGATEGSINV